MSECPPLWPVIWVNPSLHSSGCHNILNVMSQLPSNESTVKNYFMFAIAQWHILHISFTYTTIAELIPVKAVLMFWDRPSITVTCQRKVMSGQQGTQMQKCSLILEIAIQNIEYSSNYFKRKNGPY